MKHLFDYWDSLAKDLSDCSLMLFLDYDGTLTPIRDKPSQAKLTEAGKKVLRDLTALENVTVSIVSGRSVAEVKKLVSISDIIYVGNHGLEMEGPRISYKHPDALVKEELFSEITALLKEKLRMRGIIIENKQFSITVHYRLLAHDKVEKAKSIFLKTIEPYLKQKRAVITEGKKVWEVRPEVIWNKGAAVLWIIARLMAHTNKKAFPVYIGDDRTDEDALGVLTKHGMGIRVTSRLDETTHAEFFLTSPAEVFDFLKRIRDLRTLKEGSKKNYARIRN